jgi:hypothetical protein
LKAYRKFNDDYIKTVPPILIYKDFLNTGDPGNIETDKKSIHGKFPRKKG